MACPDRGRCTRCGQVDEDGCELNDSWACADCVDLAYEAWRDALAEGPS